MKKYIVRKIIEANSIREVLRIEKNQPPQEIYLSSTQYDLDSSPKNDKKIGF